MSHRPPPGELVLGVELVQRLLSLGVAPRPRRLGPRPEQEVGVAGGERVHVRHDADQLRCQRPVFDMFLFSYDVRFGFP